jgi:hypothetical protein
MISTPSRSQPMAACILFNDIRLTNQDWHCQFCRRGSACRFQCRFANRRAQIQMVLGADDAASSSSSGGQVISPVARKRLAVGLEVSARFVIQFPFEPPAKQA